MFPDSQGDTYRELSNITHNRILGASYPSTVLDRMIAESTVSVYGGTIKLLALLMS